MPPIRVIGPNHFKLTFKIDWSESKNILKEKIKVPPIKNNDIISFSFNSIYDKSSNARSWYII